MSVIQRVWTEFLGFDTLIWISSFPSLYTWSDSLLSQVASLVGRDSVISIFLLLIHDLVSPSELQLGSVSRESFFWHYRFRQSRYCVVLCDALTTLSEYSVLNLVRPPAAHLNRQCCPSSSVFIRNYFHWTFLLRCWAHFSRLLESPQTTVDADTNTITASILQTQTSTAEKPIGLLKDSPSTGSYVRLTTAMFELLKLPPELRIKVYKYALVRNVIRIVTTAHPFDAVPPPHYWEKT